MIKVFLVEDEAVIREGLRDKIPWEEYGYRFVGDAADGEMALPMIRKSRPDVIITDIKMPFMDGLSLSKIVCNEFPKTKIIIISGHDDFEYARQAIEVGVEQYLLKPITKFTLKKVLLELKEKIEQDQEQSDYQAKYMDEMHEYEQFSRRRFFEKMLEGELSVTEIYEEAAAQSLEITAPCYNLLFFSVQEKKDIPYKMEEILHFFLRHPQYILFGWNVNCYGVLIKSEEFQMEELTHSCVEHLKKACSDSEGAQWYLAVGKPVNRLSMLSECYRDVNRCFAYRFITPEIHILTEETLASRLVAQEERKIENVNPSAMDPEIIRDFLSRGSSSEIHNFVESYLAHIREALNSKMFRDYVVLNIRFATISYIESLGSLAGDRQEEPEFSTLDTNMKSEDVAPYFEDMLQKAIAVRDKESDYQSRKILRRALDYIDENYDSEALSLNSVAGEVNVSPSYFSAIFSQSMQKTFIEYVTGKRMEKAKKLLKNTEKPFGEISLEVGYKDPHYFSFVFKKTQGMSPREYRAGKKTS